MTDEAMLIAQAQQDVAAFGRLYDRYVNRIYAYILRDVRDVAVAEDITAVTFEKALRGIGRFQWRGTPFVAFLYKIARNEIVSYRRKQKWIQAWSPQHDEQPSPLNVEQMVQRSERQALVRWGIDQLAERDRDVIVLRYLEGLPNGEIATILGCSTHNVYVRLNRAMRRLRKILESAEVSYEPAR